MTKPDRLIDIGPLIEREQVERLGLGEDLDVGDLDFRASPSGPRSAALAVSSGRSRTSPVIRATYSLRRSWPEFHDTLHDAGVRIAKVDERKVFAVLTTAIDPAAHGNGSAGIGGRQLTAHVGAHRGGAILHVLVVPGC